jgi:O-antigen/teichoic acid export membrane protein
MLFVSVFEYAWKPFYLSRYEDADSNKLFARVFTYFTLASAILFLIIQYFIEFVVAMPFIGGRFINPIYWQGMSIVPLVMLGFYFNGAYNNFASAFHIEKKTNYLPVSVGIAAILNISLNFILIPYLNITGSAIATAVSYFVSAVFLNVIARKIRHIRYEWGRVLVIIFTSIVFWYLGLQAEISGNDYLILGIRATLLLLYVLVLFFFKVFTRTEIISIKNIFARNSERPAKMTD